jgi:hypothetical protein
MFWNSIFCAHFRSKNVEILVPKRTVVQVLPFKHAQNCRMKGIELYKKNLHGCLRALQHCGPALLQ